MNKKRPTQKKASIPPDLERRRKAEGGASSKRPTANQNPPQDARLDVKLLFFTLYFCKQNRDKQAQRTPAVNSKSSNLLIFQFRCQAAACPALSLSLTSTSSLSTGLSALSYYNYALLFIQSVFFSSLIIDTHAFVSSKDSLSSASTLYSPPPHPSSRTSTLFVFIVCCERL